MTDDELMLQRAIDPRTMSPLEQAVWAAEFVLRKSYLDFSNANAADWAGERVKGLRDFLEKLDARKP